MKNIDYSNQIQKEAILNECKGNVFEFLVAQGLASRTMLEDYFLLNLPSEFRNRLKDYEELMRNHGPNLLVKLPLLANETVKSIWEVLNLEQYNFTQWNVIGKMAATNDNQYWNETDIVGTYKKENENLKHLSLSIKLSKDNSFTNTKSAGVKSFLTKYFLTFGDAVTRFQNELNKTVDESFLMMGHKLYLLIDQDFRGSFDSRWTDLYTELPGELPEEMRRIVRENYYRVALKIANILSELKKINNNLFCDSLMALCGFGHSDIVQINCIHLDYELREVTIKTASDIFIKNNKSSDLLPLKDFSSSIEIVLGEMILQIRVKPMNKFTTAAYKINCSTKVR